MKSIELNGWIYYFDEDVINLDSAKIGKWMYFFRDVEFASHICKEAVDRMVVHETKHTDNQEGVACFYLNCDDIDGHKKIITFFLENNLIRRTKTGRLYNISFKLDEQTRYGEYGSDFKGEIKLDDFINLDTGDWII